jgi:hypothetical protein
LPLASNLCTFSVARPSSFARERLSLGLEDKVAETQAQSLGIHLQIANNNIFELANSHICGRATGNARLRLRKASRVLIQREQVLDAGQFFLRAIGPGALSEPPCPGVGYLLRSRRAEDHQQRNYSGEAEPHFCSMQRGVPGTIRTPTQADAEAI